MTQTEAPTQTLSVLFLCTHNSARSQMAEAIMSRKIDRMTAGRYRVASAGSEPGREVHPMAVRALRQMGIDWSRKQPKSIDAVRKESWDLVITVCDHAKESCPVMPGQPAFAHWGMDDPSDVIGPTRERAFVETASELARRIDLLLAIPFEELDRRALEREVQQIANERSASAQDS